MSFAGLIETGNPNELGVFIAVFEGRNAAVRYPEQPTHEVGPGDLVPVASPSLLFMESAVRALQPFRDQLRNGRPAEALEALLSSYPVEGPAVAARICQAGRSI